MTTTVAERTSRPIDELLTSLAGIVPSERQIVVSAYLPLEPQDRTRHRYLGQLKSRIRELQPTIERMAPSRGLREMVDRDLRRVVDAVAVPSRLPPARGLALFASEALGLFEVIPLPRVHRFRLVADRTAYVRELATIAEECGTILTAVVDRTQARIFEVTAFEAIEVADLPAAATRGAKFHSDRHGAPGWGEHDYHDRIRAEKERHYHGVAEQLQELDRRRRVHGIVVAGQGPTTAAVVRLLPAALAERCWGTTRIDLKTLDAPAVYRATLEVADLHQHTAGRAAVRELEEALGAGRAVNGIRETLEALFRGQARSLLVAHDAHAAGFRCSQSGRLVLSADECRFEGSPVPAPFLIDDVIEEALRQRLPLIVVRDPDAARIQGLAATLRFR
jgi:peptide subunit release factor 1 (eRF1)